MIDLRAQSCGADQAEGCDARRVLERDPQCNTAAERVSDQVRLGNVESVQKGGKCPRERSQVPRSDVLTRSAMPGQVKRDHSVSLGEARLGEQPVVEVAAEAVDEDH